MNKALQEYFSKEGIEHQTSIARTPRQNGVVERRNRSLVEATQTMLSAAKLLLFSWAEAIANSCFTENRSRVISRHEKTPYHIINERKHTVKFFTSLVPYATLSEMLEMLFSPMFDEYFNGATQVVSKSFVVTTTDTSDKRQQPNTTPSTSTNVATDLTQLDIQLTPEPTTQEQTVNADENINQSENAQVDEDEFINIFGTPIHEDGESSSHHVDPSNIHTLYQRHHSECHWTRDHPLEQVLGNPSQPVRTRR
ncbi:retrovirus-related pol polyprotein from transposon TNT 1-94 [Tanacetum coccineum]